MAMDEVVRQLAQTEWEAQRHREQAEVEWRSAWWETTLALADMSEVSAGYDAAMSELGQSRPYLQQRRRVGLAVATSCRAEAHGLPPTYSLEWVREGRSIIDAAAIKAILAAEAKNVSTRAFIAQVARPEVRRTPVAPPRRGGFELRPMPVRPVPLDDVVEPVSLPEPEPEPVRPQPQNTSWSPPPPVMPARPPAPSVVSPFQPQPTTQYALSSALTEIETINRAMSRIDGLLVELDDDTRPAFRARLLELSVRVQIMIEGLDPESSMRFSDRDAAQLLNEG